MSVKQIGEKWPRYRYGHDGHRRDSVTFTMSGAVETCLWVGSIRHTFRCRACGDFSSFFVGTACTKQVQCTTPKLDILRGDFGIWFMVFSSVFVRQLYREFFFMQSYTIRFFFFWSSWIKKKFECERNLAGLVWWEIKNVLHVRVHTCKYAFSGVFIWIEWSDLNFFLVLLLSPLSSCFQCFVLGFIPGFKHCILLTPNFMIEVMNPNPNPGQSHTIELIVRTLIKISRRDCP